MPGFIGDDALGRAIHVVDLELGQQRQPIAVNVATPTVEAESPSVPTVTQDAADGVAAFTQEVRHVERLVAQAVIVTGPSRVQDVIADGIAVELHLVHTEGCHIQPRSRHARADVELAAQQWTGLRASGVLFPVGRHESCAPIVGVE